MATIVQLNKRLKQMELEIKRDFGRSIKLSIEFEFISIDEVVKLVSDVSNVEVKDLIGKSRVAKIVNARQLTMYLCKKHIAGLSLKKIGEYFNKDHTSVMYSMQMIEAYLKVEDTLVIELIELCNTEIIKRNKNGNKNKLPKSK